MLVHDESLKTSQELGDKRGVASPLAKSSHMESQAQRVRERLEKKERGS